MDDLRGLTPRVIPWSPQFPLDAVMARLSAVSLRVVVRITGGCADMSASDAAGVLELFRSAFQGFEGAMLVGGTRMIRNMDPSDVLFGITEVGPAIRSENPSSFVLGVVPRCEDFGFSSETPVLVVRQQESDGASQCDQDEQFTTIVHPDQDMVIAAMTALTKDQIWDDEVEFCRYVTNMLVRYGAWHSLLVAYNGGGVTEREVRATAKRGWPVLIVQGSGRKCDELALDEEFLRQHPNVTVCQRDAESMREALEQLEVVPNTPKATVRHLRVV